MTKARHYYQDPSISLIGLLVCSVLLASGAVNLFAAISLGQFSGQAVLTIAYLFFGLLFLPAIPVRSLLPVRTVPFLVFLLWAASSLVWSSSRFGGSQNILVISNLFVLSLLSEALARFDTTFVSKIDLSVRVAVMLASGIYLVSTIVFGGGNSEILGARAFGLFALFGVARQLSRWRYGDLYGLMGAVALTILIGFSHSRFSLGIAVVLFPLSQLPSKHIGKVIKAVIVGIIAFGLAAYSVFYFDVLRERFFTGDVSLKIGPYAINASGRLAFWRATLDSFAETPIFGKGAGSAQQLIESMYVSVSHPHSDYLRVMHDYGSIGFGLWLCAMASWLRFHWHVWLLADRSRHEAASFHLFALLSLIAFLLQMLMENTLIYIFIAAPLGVIIGSAGGIANTATGQLTSTNRRSRNHFIHVTPHGYLRPQ